MKAYMITFVRFQNLEAYKREYIKPAHAILTSHGGLALAVSDTMKVIEGEMPIGRAVIVEFPLWRMQKPFTTTQNISHFKPFDKNIRNATVHY